MLKHCKGLIVLLCAMLFISSCSVVTDEPNTLFSLKDAPYGLTAVTKNNAEGFVSIYVDDYVFDTAFNKSDYTFENKLNLSWRALPEEQQKKIGSLQTLIDSFTYLTGKPQYVKSDLAANVNLTIVSDRNKMLEFHKEDKALYDFIRNLTIHCQCREEENIIVYSDRRWIWPANKNYIWTLQYNEATGFNYYFIFWHDQYMACTISGDLALECIKRSLLGEDPLTFANSLIAEYNDNYDTPIAVRNTLTDEITEYIDYTIE